MSPLLLAVPSKGRLQDQTNDFFSQCGLVMKRGSARSYRGHLSDLASVEIVYLSASEITSALATGEVHLGITGLDLIHETNPDLTHIHPLKALGFGHADVIIGLPQAWLDVETMRDLVDISSDFVRERGHRLRVATKYTNLTRTFFNQHGLIDFRLVESSGATEGAPATGMADIIVDITSTGATLKANGLKVMSDGPILRSQAYLAVSPVACWDDDQLDASATILDKIYAQETATAMRVIDADIDLTQALKEQLATSYHCDLISEDSGCKLLCPAAHQQACSQNLRKEGARRVIVSAADFVFQDTNPLFEQLKAAVDCQA